MEEHDSVLGSGAVAMSCNECGASITASDGTILAGIQAELIVHETTDELERQWYAKYMAPLELDRKYYICVPCWLRRPGQTGPAPL